MTAADDRVRTTQIGSWPGTDHALALRIAFADTPDLPVLPELPDRGPHAAMIGRATALLADLSVDLQPSGWRLIHGTARDHRRTHQLFRDDLERLEEHAQGWAGPIKIAVAGPWTLAACLQLPMGEKVLADHGARRDVADSLATGIAELRSDLTRRLPGTTIVVQLDEPMLPQVTRGEVRTDSGLHRYQQVDRADLTTPLAAIVAGGATWLHSCAADVPVAWLTGIAGLGLALDESQLTASGWDAVGASLDAGGTVALGVEPGEDGEGIARRVLRRIDRLGLGPEITPHLWLTPTCGLAGQREADAVRALRQLRTAAGIVTETLHE